MFLAEEVSDEGIVIEVQPLAVLAILDIIFINMLSIVPPNSLSLCVSFLKNRKE